MCSVLKGLMVKSYCGRCLLPIFAGKPGSVTILPFVHEAVGNMRSQWLPWAHFLALPTTRTGSLWQPFSGNWWLFLVANVKATKQRGIYYQYWIAHKLLGRKQLQAKSLEIMQESKYRYNLDRALSHYGPQRNWGTATRAWEISPFDLQPSPCCLWPLVSLTQLHGCWAISGLGPLGAFHHKHASPHTWTPTP